ncbi:MAG: VWA domain-containing protein [Acidobacteriota bacterium]
MRSTFPTSHLRPTVAAALLALLIVPPAFSQNADPAELFGDVVDVRVVNLEVVVEKGGDRVHDLTAEDFELTVDGQPIPIEFFTEVRGATAVAPFDPDVTGPSTVPALAPGEAVGTRYLVFIDDLFTITPYRNRVLKQLKKDLSFLGPDDSMAIVAFNGKSIDLLSTWSRSERELTSALRKAIDRPTQGLRFRSFRDLNDDFRFAEARTGFAADRFGPFARGAVGPGQRAYTEVTDLVDAAASTLRAFAQPEGRKTMLLVSGDWPAIDAGFEFDQPVGFAAYQSYGLFTPLVDTANLLGYTVYPVDAAGVETRFTDASVGSLRQASLQRQFSRNREFLQESTLVNIAEETGGRALLDGASRFALARVFEDTRSYYSIGFTPTWLANDERHSVDIDVPGLRGAKIRMRRSFTDVSPGTEATLRLESAQLFDLPLPSAGALTASFGEPQDKGWRKVLVPLDVQIPLDLVTKLPVDGGWASRLELRVAVTDDRGDRADIPVVPVVLKGDVAPTPGATETFTTFLKMRERPHRVLISLVDATSGDELSTRIDIVFDS